MIPTGKRNRIGQQQRRQTQIASDIQNLSPSSWAMFTRRMQLSPNSP